jgi:hypothetical protein
MSSNIIGDVARREKLRREIEHGAETQRQLVNSLSPIDRARRARLDPDAVKGRFLDRSALSAYGHQEQQGRDDPLASYGHSHQQQLGIVNDQVAVLKNRLAQSDEDAERAEWQKQQRVSAPDPETIDPRGLANRKDA